MRDLQETLRRLSEQQVQMHRAHQAEQLRRQQQAHVDVLVEVFGRLFDKGVAYTNAVILAGYAAFFAIWAFVREAMPAQLHVVTALLMTISCGTFISWEVYKIVSSARSMRQLSSLVHDEPAAAIAAFEAEQKRARRLELAQARAWAVVISVAALTGFSAALLMGGTFVWKLATDLWPALRAGLAG